MNIFQTATSFSETIAGIFRTGTLRTIASIIPIARQFSCKAFSRRAGLFALILIFSGYRASAIEGLTISIQNGTNIVLGWPSATNETYLIQTIPAFGSTNSWVVLTDNYPASINPNWTTYVITNVVPAPSGGEGGSGSGSGSPPLPDDESLTSSTTADDSTALAPGDSLLPPSPWIPASLPNGGILKASGEIVPLPAFCFSSEGRSASLDGETPSSPPDPGFYEVVRDGAHIFGLTNGAVLSGEVAFPIEYAVANADQITGVSFYDTNDSPVIGAAGLGTNSQWSLDWDTAMTPNGIYTIYAEIDYASNQPAMSLPVTVTVSNVISFPNYLTQMYGNQMWIFAQTIPNAAYEIDMYDESNNYLGSFGDYADPDGYISFLWNLVDYTGTMNSSTNFTGVFTVDTSSLSGDSIIRGNASAASTNLALAHKTPVNVKSNGIHPDGGSPTASATQYWTYEPKWTAKNTWVVAYGAIAQGAAIQNADIFMIAGGVYEDDPYHGVLGTLDPEDLNGNLSPGNNPSGGQVFTMSDPTSRSNLLAYLASGNYDNFYFFGHGSASSIGAYNGTALTQGDISSALNNFPLSNGGIKHVAMTPYRFVFIDGCDTGKGNFCEAFAIPAAAVSTNYYAAAGLESRAFVGFKHWTLNVNFVGIWQGYSEMTAHFLSDWQSGQVNVQQCVNNATHDVYNTGKSMDSSAVAYGAIDVKYNTHTGQ